MDQEITNTGPNSINVNAGGDVHLHNGPSLKLICHHNRTPPLRHPLDVINAFSTRLPLIGREGELALFRSWLTDSRRIAVRCIAGQAGSGKSRLGIELCAVAQGMKWDAGFATHKELETFAGHRNLSDWGWTNPTLIVIDYAAAKAKILKGWLEELALNDRSNPPLRILLLERHAEASGWWAELQSPAAETTAGLKDMFGTDKPLVLPGLDDPEQRRSVVEAMMTAAHPLLDDAPPLRPISGDFERRIRDRTRITLPLDLAMAAVMAVYDGTGTVQMTDRAEMAFQLAGFEKKRLEKLARDQGLDLAVILHMTALVTMAGALSWDEVQAALAAEAEAEHWQIGTKPYDRALLDLLPGDTPQYAHPLQPDLIGEAWVLTVLATKPEGCQQRTVKCWHDHWPGPVEEALIRTIQDFGDDARGEPAVNGLTAVVEGMEDAGVDGAGESVAGIYRQSAGPGCQGPRDGG